MLAPALAVRSISLLTSSHSEKLRSPSIPSRSKPGTWANDSGDAASARLGSPKKSASFLKLVQPSPRTRASASQAAYSLSSATAGRQIFSAGSTMSMLCQRHLRNHRYRVAEQILGIIVEKRGKLQGIVGKNASPLVNVAFLARATFSSSSRPGQSLRSLRRCARRDGKG